MTFDPQVSIGSIIAGLSVAISAAALAIGWQKDRLFRRREYADRIRTAAGRVSAALERWQLLALQIGPGLQPAILDAANLAASDPAAARRLLLRALHEQRADIGRRIADERLETAYVDLYGYDPRIHVLFNAAVRLMQALDTLAFERLRERLTATFDTGVREGPADPDALAASLRECVEAAARGYARETGAVVNGFRGEMLKIVEATDDAVIARSVSLAGPDDALPPPPAPLAREIPAVLPSTR